MPSSTSGSSPATYVLFEGKSFRTVEHKVVREGSACIYLNGQEIATLMCTPHDLEDLAVGFLRSEEIISGPEEIAVMTVAANAACVDVWLNRAAPELPGRRIVTSGCGGGTTFDDVSRKRAPLPLLASIEAGQVGPLLKKLYQSANLYAEVRGCHAAALSDGTELLLVAEDIARHNTIDRLWGRASRQGVVTRGRVLLCTGRVSSEMLTKAARMEIPIVISRTSPTSLSVELARAWNVTLIGYARGNGFRIYSAPERVALGATG